VLRFADRSPPSLLLSFSRSRRSRVFPFLNQSADKFISPLVYSEPIPPQRQYFFTIVQKKSNGHVVELHNVMLKTAAIRWFDIHQTKSNPFTLIDSPLTVDFPRQLFRILDHGNSVRHTACSRHGARQGRPAAHAFSDV